MGRARVAALIALTVLLAVLAVGSLLIDVLRWPFQNFIRNDGDLLEVVVIYNSPRLLTFSVGLASRESAGGVIRTLTGPLDLGDLARPVRPAGAISPYSAYYLYQMSMADYRAQEYDPVLSAQAISSLLEANDSVEFPEGVVAVIADEPDGTVVLFTDESHTKVYCVPGPLVPAGVGP